MVVSSPESVGQPLLEVRLAEELRLERQRSAPADPVPIHLHDRRGVPEVAHQRARRRRRRACTSGCRRRRPPAGPAAARPARGATWHGESCRRPAAATISREASICRRACNWPATLRLLVASRSVSASTRTLPRGSLLRQRVDHRPSRIARRCPRRSTLHSRDSPAAAVPCTEAGRNGSSPRTQRMTAAGGHSAVSQQRAGGNGKESRRTRPTGPPVRQSGRRQSTSRFEQGFP